MSVRHTRGFALVPVVLMLALIGAISYLMNMESGMTSRSMDKQFESRQAGYAAEAAYHHERWRLQRTATCTGYGGLTSSFGSASYSASVSPDNGSPVMITATGVAGTDSSQTVRGSVTTFSETGTLILQPGADGIDSFIWDGAHDSKNFGASNILRLDSTGKEQAILIQFDLSSISDGAIIRKADLELYAYSGNNEQTGIVSAHHITTAWGEGDLDDEVPIPGEGVTYTSPNGGQSWENHGADYDANPAATVNISDSNPKWMTWEITESVAGWNDNTLANHGLLLRVSSGDINKREFASGDATDATLHPKLTIEYACACGTPCSEALLVSDSLVLSNTRAASLGGIDFQQTDLVEYNPGTDLGALRMEGFPLGLRENVDALHILGDGTYVLSTKNDETLGGLAFSRDDLIRYDASTDTATIYFKSRLHFVDGSGSINGASVLRSGNLVLSVEEKTEIAGVTVQSNDLIEFDPRRQSATLLLSGDDVGLRETISAVHVLADGHLIFAVANATSFAGVSFLPGDLIDYDPDSGQAKRYMSGETAFGNQAEAVQSVSVLDGQSPSVPIDPRLVAHWKLDETSGTIAADSAGDHDGTIDGPVWTEGQIEGAAQFDGNNDLILVSHADTLSLQDEFTLSGWFRLESVSLFSSHRLLSKESSGRNDNYFLSSQGPNLYLGIDEQFFSPPTLFLPAVWYHVAATFDDAANEIRFYVNGSEVLSVTTTARLSPNTDPLYLGNSWEDSKPFDGRLDDLRIYNYALAPNEIGSLMTATTTDFGEADIGAGGGGSEKDGATTGTYRDNFNADDTYAGSDGSLEWADPWVEVNESDGPGRGDEVISADFGRFELRMADNNGRGEGVSRAVDLAQCKTSSFSFDYRRDGFDRASDYVTVSASGDGGSTWKELQVIDGADVQDDNELVPARHDLSEFLSSKAQIRFITSSTLGSKDYLYIDNVEITCN